MDALDKVYSDALQRAWVLDMDPDALRDYFHTLDEIRASGRINMYEVAPHLSTFHPELTDRLARRVLRLWMECFGMMLPADDNEFMNRILKEL